MMPDYVCVHTYTHLHPVAAAMATGEILGISLGVGTAGNENEPVWESAGEIET
jgi:hypothetical protein